MYLATASPTVDRISSGRIILGYCLSKLRSNLPREIPSIAFGIEKTVIIRLNDSDIFGSDGFILSKRRVSCAGFRLESAVSTTERSAVFGGTIIRLFNYCAQVEDELAEICLGNDADRCSIKRVASSNVGVDNFVQRTLGWVVILSMLHHRREHVKDLLLCLTECWSTGDGTIVQLAPVPNPAHALTPTRVPFVVGVDLRLTDQTIKIRRNCLADKSPPPKCLISKHVGSVLVDGPIPQRATSS